MYVLFVCVRINEGIKLISCLYDVSDQGARSGDSGAGLTFEHDNLQYLTGVVSLKDLQINNSVALFTDVNYNSRWICDAIRNYTDVKSDCQYFAYYNKYNNIILLF